jgi:hypothetical protein
MNTYGTNSATSTSGVESVMADAMPLARVNASSFVCGLSFQLPEIRGLRAWADGGDVDGPKAEAE